MKMVAVSNTEMNSPPSAPSFTFTSPSSLGSNSMLSPFSDAESESQGLWSKDLRALDQASNQTVASDHSVASVGVSFEQSKFDLNGDDYTDFYDEIRSRSGTKRAARSMSLDSAACSGQLSISPRQLADIFSIFHGTDEDEDLTVSDTSSFYHARKPTKKVVVKDTDSDAATEVTSNTFSPSTVAYNPKIESLQRECEALKQIINSDSSKMLQLQTERKELQETINRFAKEKRELEKQVRILEMEKNACLERQKNQDETIRRLKAELQNIPSDKTYAGASIHDIEELRLANELLASQVIYAERELQRANSDRDSDKENIPPPVAPMTPEKKSDWGTSETYDALQDVTPQTLAMQLKSLETRLKAMEDDAASRTSKHELELSDKATQSEFVEHEQDTLIGWSIVLDGVGVEGVEVGLDGTLSVATIAVENETFASTDQDIQSQHLSLPAGNASSREYFCDCLHADHNNNDD